MCWLRQLNTFNYIYIVLTDNIPSVILDVRTQDQCILSFITFRSILEVLLDVHDVAGPYDSVQGNRAVSVRLEHFLLEELARAHVEGLVRPGYGR